MNILEKVNENIKRGIRSWLNLTAASPYTIQINEVLDFETNAIRNRIWYRGDSNELEQVYRQTNEYADKHKFWASKCSPGMEMRKIHTGIPGLIVRTLAAIVLNDMNDLDFKKPAHKDIWDAMDKEDCFADKLEEALKEALYIGDGAFKITIDTDISQYPILEWFPGERVEFVTRRDRIREVVFKTPYKAHGKLYVLNEVYGYGYIRNELYMDGKRVDLTAVETLSTLQDGTFDKSVMLAVPLRIYKSSKYDGRGGSVFDGKLDAFDALDEAWSQWMDAVRSGRAKTYIPESLVPRDPNTGMLLTPNAFDNRFLATGNDMSENGSNKINTEQPDIPHESYLAAYCTALDLCLQGIISPSTLGIDVKKLDNADAQREKEKTTLYTRDAIIRALSNTLPKVVAAVINAYQMLHKKAPEEVGVDVSFGQYANPSFESQVETLAKARPGTAIMSIEAQVEELYGDTRSAEWKREEVERLKAEQGISLQEEPALGLDAESLLWGGDQGNEGESGKPNVPDEPEGVPGASGNSKGAGSDGNLRGGKG